VATTTPASARETPPIESGDYDLEIFQGPLLAPGRITGLAGATTAMAESLDGVYNNAAAPAVRAAHSVDHFEWEPTGGIAFPGTYKGTDFSNRGEKGIERQIEQSRNLGSNRPPAVTTTDDFLYLNAGLWGQLGNVGVTATADMLRYELTGASDDGSSLALSIVRMHLVGAYGFLRNQLCVGAGVRMAYVDVWDVAAGTSVVSMIGVGPQAGLIVKPEERQWRVGLTARAGVAAEPLSDVFVKEKRTTGVELRRVGSFVLPERIVQPWEVELGVAYQLGPRPLNPRWIDPYEHEQELRRQIQQRRLDRAARQRWELEAMPADTEIQRAARAARASEMAREEAAMRAQEDLELADAEKRLHDERKARYANWPREHVLLLASVLVTGPSTTPDRDAVALEGFIDQRRELVGSRVAVGPRFAVESEAVPNRLKARAGVYFEPSRFADATVRQHFTLGFDVRLFAWDVFGLFPDHQWRFSTFVDVAERYHNFGFGVGLWH